MKAELKGNDLIITIPFDKIGKDSESGKSLIHASTKGAFTSEILVGEKKLVVSVNAYTSKKGS